MIPFSRRRNRLFTGLFAAVLATTGIAAGAAPASAAPPAAAPTLNFRTIDYVALGDSYASGQGADPRQEGGVCERTRFAYPRLLDLVPLVKLTDHVACKGASAADVLAGQVHAVKRGTDLVTLTAGVNDLGLVPTLALCAANMADPACQQGLASLQFEIGRAADPDSAFSLAGQAVLAVILAADARASNAEIVVTGYPYPLEPGAAPPELITLVNVGTDALNGAIAAAVQAARNAGVDATYVDVTGIFAGHGVGSRQPWLILPSQDSDDAFHPNVAGQAAYAYAVGRAAF